MIDMLTDDMEALAELIRTITIAGVTRQALLLRTERLPGRWARPERARHVRACLEPLTKAERAQWFNLPGGRIVVSWKNDPGELLRQSIGALNQLLQSDAGSNVSAFDFIKLFTLPNAGEELMRAATSNLAVLDDEVSATAEAPASTARVLQPFEPAELDRLEQSLTGTDMSRFARRRPVSLYNGHTARLAWEERSLSIPELIEAVAPGRDPRSDVWLFRRLTRVLDRRMLSILSDPREIKGASPFSLTLNVASVLSPEFLRFDAVLPAGLRSRVVISFLPADVVSDAGAFAFARNFMRGRSYRVGLRAISAALLPALDFVALDLDYIQLIWSPELKEITELPAAGSARWIVGQPCTREAADWGVKLGIGLFTMKPTT